MEIQCPICGRMNPDDLEVCGGCSSPLHPAPQTKSKIEARPESGDVEQGNESPALPAEELPEWLRALYSEEIASGSKEALAAFGPLVTEKGDDLPSSQDSVKDLPTWLGEVEQRPAKLSQEADFAPGDLKKSKTAISTQGTIEPQEQTVLPAASVLWSESSSDKGIGVRSEISSVKEQDQISKQKIVSRVEKTGILAGLTNALSAEPGISQARKSETQPLAIKATANQRAHADLLKTLVDTEGKVSEIPSSKPSSSQRYIRWIIGLLVIAAIIWVTYQNEQQLGFPLYIEETSEVNRLVNQLPPNAKVLVGFDYSPSLVAELEAAAQPVIDHILRRGSQLTLISTSTAGPLLAERFMGSIQSLYEPTDKSYYANLGVIPGGPMGLQSFAHDLQKTAPLTLDSNYAWGNGDQPVLPPLQGIGELSDYDMILVLADEADVARAWIEQIKPNLDLEEALTSLIMVSSAQVEPVVRPYFDGNPRQLDGLVAGLRGGAAYANLTNTGGLPRLYWDIYGFGLFLAAMILLLGSLAYSVIPSLTQPESSKGVEV